MKLAIDAMSGDRGSEIVVQACEAFLQKNTEDTLYVVGKVEELQVLAKHPQVILEDARDVIDMHENIVGIRHKKEASMVKAMLLARKGTVDAVVSCGNTGAYFAAASLFLKRLKGVERSCLMAQLPNLQQQPMVMLDVGANAENTAQQLLSFAIMGSIYMRAVYTKAKPSVALLNIGNENHKGDALHQETYTLLENNPMIHFVGNIEGKEILAGEVDVIVTDGFSGNIALKTAEGVANTMFHVIKDSLLSSTKGKIGAWLAKDNLMHCSQVFNADSAGGALMIGLEKPVIKAHGASNAAAFESAMHIASTMVNREVAQKIKEGLIL